ncbi:MAG: hypothetical protein FJW88_11665 [Actinobacteria bacterium]|nr:hypothetical protein [Actinomycetota bacterium]
MSSFSDPEASAERRRRSQAAIDPDLTVPRHLPRRVRPLVLLLVAVGGALGTACRYGVARAMPVETSSFPWATFTVNVTGCLLLGALLTCIVERWPPSRCVRPFAAIGFLGAFTTFSTFVVDADVLVRDGHAATAVGYFASSLLMGVGAVYVGIAAARRRPGRRRETA